jgi:TfoX/Sxy family transcriptional regulator of competence genes
MAYNLDLAKRVQAGLAGKRAVEKKMFGGVGYLLRGNMACGVHGDGLIVRVDPDRHTELLKRAGARPFDLTGKPMKGWLIVDPPGYKTDRQLENWIAEGVKFALSLPPK